MLSVIYPTKVKIIMGKSEALSDVEKESTTQIETLTVACTLCGSRFIIQPSEGGNIAVPVEGTTSECPESEEGVHRLNLVTLY